MSEDPRSRNQSVDNVRIQHQAYQDGIPGRLPRRQALPLQSNGNGSSTTWHRPEGLSRAEGSTVPNDQLARLDISRNETTPSPSPSYTHRADSQETPSVTSQSEGEEDEDGPSETSGFGSALIRKRQISSSLLRTQHHHQYHLGRESSTDTLEDDHEAGISKTVLEKAWGPAPTKRRTKSWLSVDLDKTPGYELPDQLSYVGGNGAEVEPSESDAGTSADGDEKRSIADDLPPEIILQVSLAGLTSSLSSS